MSFKRILLFSTSIGLLLAILFSLTSRMALAATSQQDLPSRQAQQSTPQPTPDDPDLTGVALQLDDLPDSFTKMPPDQTRQMGTTISSVVSSWIRTNAQPTNLVGYWKVSSTDLQLVVSALYYPLSEIEQQTFDTNVANPDQIMYNMEQFLAASGLEAKPSLLKGLEKVGDSSIGLSLVTTTSGMTLRMEIFIGHRGAVVEEILVAYLEGNTPQVNTSKLAQILDRRLAKALGIEIEEVEAETPTYRPTAPLVPELTTHIPTPLDLSTDPAVVGTNLLLAAIAMIFLTIASELANRTLEENEEGLQKLLRPARWVGQGMMRFEAAVGKRLRRAVLLDLIRLSGLILIYGLTFSFLEPGWNLFSLTGFYLFFCLTIGGGIVGLADDVVQWISARRANIHTELKLHPANLLLAITSTGFSRLLGIVPGFMFGTPEAIEIDEAALDSRRKKQLLLIGAVTVLIIGLSLWLATILTNLLQRADLPKSLEILIGGTESLFLSIFALTLQNVFVQMLALPNSYGRALLRWNRWIWGTLFLAITFVFYHTLINPKGNLASAWGSKSVKFFLITAAIASVVSLAIWLFFKLRNGGRAQGYLPADTLPPTALVSPLVESPTLQAAELLAATPLVAPPAIEQPAGASPDVDAVIFGLKSPDLAERQASLQKMIAFGGPAVEPLVAYLKHPDAWARLMAVAALGKLKDARAFNPLRLAQDDPDEGVRYMAGISLTELARQPGMLDNGAAKVCPQCRKIIKSQAQVCRYCHLEFMAPEPVQPAPAEPPSTGIEAAFYTPPAPKKPAVVAPTQAPQPAATKTCPTCGQKIIAEARFCSFCRAQFEVTVQGYCMSCHNVVEADELDRCRRCGKAVIDKRIESRLISAPSGAQPSPAPVPTPIVQPKPAAPAPIVQPMPATAPAPKPHQYLIVLYPEIPPSQGQLRELVKAVSSQDGLPVELLDAIRVTGAMPTTADSYVVTVAHLACQKHLIPIETSRDTIAYRPAVSAVTGMRLGLVIIKIRS